MSERDERKWWKPEWRHLKDQVPAVLIVIVSVLLVELGRPWFAVAALSASLLVSAWHAAVSARLFEDMSGIADEAIGLAREANALGSRRHDG